MGAASAPLLLLKCSEIALLHLLLLLLLPAAATASSSSYICGNQNSWKFS